MPSKAPHSSSLICYCKSACQRRRPAPRHNAELLAGCSHIFNDAGRPFFTQSLQTRVKQLSQTGCSCNPLSEASDGDKYVLSLAHASELSHQDVDIRDRLTEALLTVHPPTKGLETDHKLTRAVLTHCVQTMTQACTRHARKICANSSKGLPRNESHVSSIIRPISDSFVS